MISVQNDEIPFQTAIYICRVPQLYHTAVYMCLHNSTVIKCLCLRSYELLKLTVLDVYPSRKPMA